MREEREEGEEEEGFSGRWKRNDMAAALGSLRFFFFNAATEIGCSGGFVHGRVSLGEILAALEG